MSVLMLFRVAGDARRLEELAQQRREVLSAIAAKAKTYGLIRHRFFGTDDEIIVVDEWPTAEDFQRFFDDSPEIQQMMGSVGVTGEPTITFARALATGDEVG